MAFPTIPTTGNGRMATPAFQANTLATRTFPTLTGLTAPAGDLLVAVIVAYQRSAAGATFSGWTGGFAELADVDGGTSTTMAVGIATKTSTGAETGQIQVTQAGTPVGHVGMFIFSIAGWDGTTAPELTALAVGTAAIADPGALAPSWGAEDTLWISVAGSGETGTGGSYTGMGSATGGLGPPTNYADQIGTGESGDLIGAAAAAVAFRQNNTASEDIGPWTNVDVSNARNCALLIAVRPVAPPLSGSATGTVDTAGSATGRHISAGSATGTLEAAGSATGTAPVSGPPSGFVEGTVATSGSATGTAAYQGAATGTVTASGTSTGSVAHEGAATSGLSTTGTAAGARPSEGAATGTVVTAGSATGSMPAVGVNDGFATSSVTLAGSATGERASLGSATGTLTTTGAATGDRISLGLAVGAVTAVGTADGGHPLEATVEVNVTVGATRSRSAIGTIAASRLGTLVGVTRDGQNP